jgi:hypothetical protein
MEYVSYTDGKIPSVKLLNLVVRIGMTSLQYVVGDLLAKYQTYG